MSLALALLIAAAIWILVLVFALGLCRAAKAGDQTTERIPNEARGGEILHTQEDQGAADGDLIDRAPRPSRSSPIAASRQFPQARARDDDHVPPARPQRTRDVSAPPGLPTAPANVANRRTSGAGPEPTPTSSPPPTTADSLTPLRALPLDAAAELLRIDPQTLLDWEQEYGYPRSIGGHPTGQRYYSRIEVIVLKDALQRTLSIGSAIRTARSLLGERHNTPSDTTQFSSHSDTPPRA